MQESYPTQSTPDLSAQYLAVYENGVKFVACIRGFIPGVYPVVYPPLTPDRANQLPASSEGVLSWCDHEPQNMGRDALIRFPNTQCLQSTPYFMHPRLHILQQMSLRGNIEKAHVHSPECNVCTLIGHE